MGQAAGGVLAPCEPQQLGPGQTKAQDYNFDENESKPSLRGSLRSLDACSSWKKDVNSEYSFDHQYAPIDDEESYEGFLADMAMMQSRNAATSRQDGVPLGGRKTKVLEAKSCLPWEYFFTVPEGKQPGDTVWVRGPHCRMPVVLGKEDLPGSKASLRIVPKVAYKVTVPEGTLPGAAACFKAADGKTYSVPVPKGLKPGDTFDAHPPTLMVLCPNGARPGDTVRTSFMTETLTAEVPEGAKPGNYFTIPFDKYAELFCGSEQEGSLLPATQEEAPL
mmetsp:Transcript_2271/g.4746  ORF Transcript_2271/g.4746 Transcript_2271/m.4746 type:complete len:277 (+) Transcript_2271:151-981(+)|eukprot:CAMPEP_0178454564 /NCGR_PEP_ID=MMETSP0689_2-20121128/45431_1 /TAXON_ID=160604 /ORGANISM="Amphidinium massartii, Strain CS-259" /LENGTH=276 /DNA_ID=CAMNT_0020080517 /DNA_START=88 /DNA_END=918 /DNA_ORIENTATION=+